MKRRIALCLVSFFLFGCLFAADIPRRPQFAVLVTAMVMLGIAISGCGGNASSSQANRGTAAINVIARSGAISHTTTVRVTVQ